MNSKLSVTFARWAEWFFTGGSPDETAGHEAVLEHSWNWPAWATLVLVATCLAFVVNFYRRERGLRGNILRYVLAALRATLVLLTVFMLLGYQLRPYRTDLPDLVLALDVSESMSLVDHYDDKQLEAAMSERLKTIGLSDASRLNLAKMLLLENNGHLLEEIRRRYHLRFYQIGSVTRAQTVEPSAWSAALRDLKPTDPASRLGQAIREILEAQRGRPTAAIVVMTDGITTEGKSISEAATLARARRVQLFTVGLGNDQPARNVHLADLVADDRAFVGDRIAFECRLTAAGYHGVPVRVRLRRKGDSHPLDEATITVEGGSASQTITLHDTPLTEGKMEYEVEAEPLAGETDVGDNVLRQSVTVANPTIKVLLVGETPSYEFRYLKTLLGRELKRGAGNKAHAFELSTILQEADWGPIEPTAKTVFPVSPEELNQYHVVIFGDVNPARLESGDLAGGGTAQAQLVQFVRDHGGGLILVAGPRHMPSDYLRGPLAELFPFDPSAVSIPDVHADLSKAYPVVRTRLGRELPQFRPRAAERETEKLWTAVPGFYWCAEVGRVKPGVRVLLEHGTQTAADGSRLPIVCTQYNGSGQVVFHATDETWRWRWRTGESLYSHYWIQSIRQLARSSVFQQAAGVQLVSDRQQYRLGDAIHLRASFLDERQAPARDDGLTVQLKQADGKTRRIALHREGSRRGTFSGTMSDLGEGEFQAWLTSSPSATCEFHVAPPLGERAAHEMDAVDLQRAATETGGQFYTIRNVERLAADLPAGRQVRIEALPPVSLWNSWRVASLFLLLLVTEWLLRKRAGLI